MIRTALAAEPAQRFSSCAAMIEALEHACEVHGWTAAQEKIKHLMHALLGAPVPVVEVEAARAEPTVVITRPRRLARGTEHDRWDDDAPTRGRRSLLRMWNRLAA